MTRSDTSRLQFNSLLARSLKRAPRDEAGAALVEAALSISILFMLLFGIMGVAMAAYSYHYLGNAAHQAARYAIVRGGSWAGSCDGTGNAGSGYSSDMCTASPEDIENFVATRGFPGIHITSGDVCVEYFGTVQTTPSSTCDGNSGPNGPGDIVQVTITYPFTFTVPFLGNYTYNMASTSQMVIAQ